MAWFAPAIGLAGKIMGGIFGLKQKQGDLVQGAIKLAGEIQNDEAKAKVAAFQMAIAESQSESWLTRTYRPLIPTVYLMFFLSFAFGYTPEALLVGEMPPIIAGMFDILNTVVLVGYPSRTLDKIVKQVNLGKMIQSFINKKIL